MIVEKKGTYILYIYFSIVVNREVEMPIRAIKLCGFKFVHSEFAGNVFCDMKVEMFDLGKINTTIKYEK